MDVCQKNLYAVIICFLYSLKILDAEIRTVTCNTQLSVLKYSITTVKCPAECWRDRSSLCGSEIYSSGPICLAAMHSALLDQSGGIVQLYKNVDDKNKTLKGSTMHGVKSHTCNPTHKNRFTFSMTCHTNGEAQYDVNKVWCPPGCGKEQVIGNGVYNINSSVCAAAIHAGKIKAAEGGEVTFFKIMIPQNISRVNGSDVTSFSKTTFNESYTFQNFNECNVFPGVCLNNSTCIDLIAGFACKCKPGYKGLHCQSTIECLAPQNVLEKSWKARYKFGEKVTLACKDGYCLNDGADSKCLENGNWSSQCVLIDLSCKSNLSFYHVDNKTRNWQNARNYCQSIGADLIAYGMRNASIRTNIAKYLLKGNNYYWIGLSDRAVEGHFVYVDGVNATRNNTLFWASQPDNSGGSEDCVQWQQRYWKMNDINCVYAYYSICEFPCHCSIKRG